MTVRNNYTNVDDDLYGACEEGNLSKVMDLMENHGAQIIFNYTGADYHRMNALSCACRENKKEIVQYILEKSCQKQEAKNNLESPLLEALGKSHIDLASYIMSQHGAHIQSLNSLYTHIYYSYNDKSHFVEFLMTHPDIVSKKDFNENTVGIAFEIASEKGYLKEVEYILEKMPTLNLEKAFLNACKFADFNDDYKYNSLNVVNYFLYDKNMPVNENLMEKLIDQTNNMERFEKLEKIIQKRDLFMRINQDLKEKSPMRAIKL